MTDHEIHEPGRGADRRWVEQALDAVAALSLTFQGDLQRDPGLTDVFDATRPVLKRLGGFDAVAFFEVNEDGLGFDLGAADPPEAAARFREEVAAQTQEGTFAWALYQNRPVVVQGANLAPWVVLHVLATPSGVRGMFVGSLPEGSSFIPDAAEKALSIVLLQSASVLESSALHRRLAEHNRNLERIVDQRTQELRRSEAAARAASRAKGEFLASMSHEIRTPMNSILGMAAILSESELDQERLEQTDTIVRSAKSLLALIDDLLDYTKIEAGRLRLESVAFDLRDVVDDVAEMLAHRAERKGVKLAVRYAVDAPRWIRGDPGRVRQIVTNLAGNAVKFTSRGHVLIDVQAAPGDQVRIEVVDTGIGIEPEALEAIFRKYEQADASTTRRFGGTGLGLPISRRLTELMGGRISVESTPGRGSTFRVSIPVRRAEPIGAPEPSLAGRTFLVLSADPETQESVSLTIRAADGEALCEADPALCAPALAWSTSAGRPLNGVLIDAALGSAVVAHAASELRRAEGGAKLGLVALVSATGHGTGPALLRAGFDAWIRRPVRASRLVATLADPRGAGAAITRRASELAPLPASRILLVEDDSANTAVATAMLRRLGAQVHAVPNGKEGVDAALGGGFDLVLMDCQMPVMDGFDATAAIRAAGLDLPILGLTASTLASDRDRALRVGMSDHLTKPITPKALRTALERWLQADRPAADVEGRAESGDPRRSGETGGPSGSMKVGVELPVLDMDELTDRVGSDLSILLEALDLFMDEWPNRVHKLRRALDARDGDEIGQLTHKIRGGASLLAAHRVVRSTLQVDRAWDRNDPIAVEDAITALDVAVKDLGRRVEELHRRKVPA